MLAEALNQNGKTAKALVALNAVDVRAGMSAYIRLIEPRHVILLLTNEDPNSFFNDTDVLTW
jgi:hypothetical protein